MAEQHPEPEGGGGDQHRPPVPGESLWVDVMKSMGCGVSLLLLTIVVGGALGIAIMAPWGRASFDCSIYCVLSNYFSKLLGG